MRWLDSLRTMLEGRGARLALGAMLAALALHHLGRAIHRNTTTGWVDLYWADFWLISFTDGYERRALLGQITRWLSPDTLDHRVLNVVTVALAVAIVGLSLAWITRSLRDAPPAERTAGDVLIVAGVLLAGPTTTVLFETLGDPLQVVLAVALLFIGSVRHLGRLAARLLGMALALWAVLIHEASLFLVLPAIVMALVLAHPGPPASAAAGRAPSLRLGGLVLAVYLGAVAFALLFNQQHPSTYGSYKLAVADGSLYHPTQSTLQPLTTLLRTELGNYFGGIGNLMKTGRKLVGAMLWPLLFIACLPASLRGRSLFRMFLLLTVVAAPLYVIAHDWGRFAVHTLLLALALQSVAPPQGLALDDRPGRWLERVAAPFERLALPTPALLVLALLYFAHPIYRINGLTTRNIVVLVLAFGLLHALQRWQRARAVAVG